MATIHEFPGPLTPTEEDTVPLRPCTETIDSRLGRLLQADSSQFSTDIGRALLFAQCFEGYVYYQPDTKHWAIWDYDRGRWLDEHAAEGSTAINKIAQDFLLRMHQIADDRRMSVGADLLSGLRLREVVKLAKHQPALLKSSTEFNTNPYLLGVANGVVDLRTGTVYERARESLVTMYCPVPYYSRRIHSDLWDSFLVKITGDDFAYRVFLRNYLGSMLCGHNAHETFSLLHGPAGTGKGTIISAIQSILGPYAMTLNTDSLSKRGAGGIRDDLASLAGKRLVFLPELTDDSILDLTIIKTLTGQDVIRARKLYQDARMIRPTWSILVGSNHWPRFSSEPDSGWWRRVVVLPFNRVPDKRDPTIKPGLLELEQQISILSWLVQGCRSYFRQHTPQRGWTFPETIRKAKSSYHFEYDHLGAWIGECTRAGSTRQRVTNTDIWASYHAWREFHHIEHEMDGAALGRALTKAGYQPYRASNERGRMGIILREPTTSQNPTIDSDRYVSFGDFEA
jgi:putative DNA primase/helicase